MGLRVILCELIARGMPVFLRTLERILVYFTPHGVYTLFGTPSVDTQSLLNPVGGDIVLLELDDQSNVPGWCSLFKTVIMTPSAPNIRWGQFEQRNAVRWVMMPWSIPEVITMW